MSSWKFTGQEFAVSFYNGEETVEFFYDDIEAAKTHGHEVVARYGVERVTIYRMTNGEWETYAYVSAA